MWSAFDQIGVVSTKSGATLSGQLLGRPIFWPLLWGACSAKCSSFGPNLGRARQLDTNWAVLDLVWGLLAKSGAISTEIAVARTKVVLQSMRSSGACERVQQQGGATDALVSRFSCMPSGAMITMCAAYPT